MATNTQDQNAAKKTAKAERLAETDALMKRVRKVLTEGDDEDADALMKGVRDLLGDEEDEDAEQPESETGDEPEAETKPSPIDRFNGDFDAMIDELLDEAAAGGEHNPLDEEERERREKNADERARQKKEDAKTPARRGRSQKGR